jgi:Ig-like domain from next to BRCA1 gene
MKINGNRWASVLVILLNNSMVNTTQEVALITKITQELKMKNVRFVSILMAVAMLVTAVIPFAVIPAAALGNSPLNSSLSAPINMVNPVSTDGYDTAYTSNYSCALLNQKPKDWVTMKPRQSFDMIWTVQNTGPKWDADYVQFKYLWGAKMQTHGDLFGLNSSVGRGNKTKLFVDMIAPKTPGTYPITWGLYTGNTFICRVTFIVTVVK